MAELKFSCTMCGACCQNSIPLTLDESIFWLEDSGKVHLYVEADPWPTEPPIDDSFAAHRKRRSFPALCGSSQARITVILVAAVSGTCKNLQADMRCRIYEKRPLVCRIYPAEISPFIQLDAANKSCPPEAWGVGETLLKDGELVKKSRQTDQDDAPLKSLLCSVLNIDVAALAGEGFTSYEPEPQQLLDALRHVRAVRSATLPSTRSWLLYSKIPERIQALSAQGFQITNQKRAGDIYTFLWSQTR